MITKENAISIIKENGGMIRFAEAVSSGINPTTLRTMVQKEQLVKLSRGLYRLADADPMINSDFSIIAKKFPNAVICLDSALTYHNITDIIPSEVHIAIRRGTRVPKNDYPRIKVHKFSDKQFSTGIVTKKIDGVNVKIYDIEKTIVDLTRMRRRTGLEIVKQAIREYISNRNRDFRKLIVYANICRIKYILTTYVEAMI